MTVPAGQTLTLAANTAGTLLTFDHFGGTAMSATDAAVPNSGSRKIDGTIRVTGAGETRTYVIKAPTPMTGTLSSSAVFTPTSGVFETTHVEKNLATLSGINAQVSGDTDQNGSKDLTFTMLTSSLLL